MEDDISLFHELYLPPPTELGLAAFAGLDRLKESSVSALYIDCSLPGNQLSLVSTTDQYSYLHDIHSVPEYIVKLTFEIRSAGL